MRSNTLSPPALLLLLFFFFFFLLLSRYPTPPLPTCPHRPLGGIFFGWLTDSRGRKPGQQQPLARIRCCRAALLRSRAALMWTVLLMAVSCLAIALTPKYDDIGAWSPFFFFISRALQVTAPP